MLKNIPPILSPELLKVLCEMGHGDEIVIADGNFPSETNGQRVVRADGIGGADAEAVAGDHIAADGMNLCAAADGQSDHLTVHFGEGAFFACFFGSNCSGQEEPPILTVIAHLVDPVIAALTIAIKPGKPTILGKAGCKPLVGLPGHPVAAYFITKLFVLPLLSRLMGRKQANYTITARISESVSANHGRAQYHCCRLEQKDGQLYAYPIRGKSGLITTLAGADGYFCIDRDCEGLPKFAEIQLNHNRNTSDFGGIA